MHIVVGRSFTHAERLPLRSVASCGACLSESSNFAASFSLQFLRFAISLIACSRVSSVSIGGEYGCLCLSIILTLSRSQ